MQPERISFNSEGHTHFCLRCDGGITWEMNDEYNRIGGFSGYDEIPDTY